MLSLKTLRVLLSLGATLLALAPAVGDEIRVTLDSAGNDELRVAVASNFAGAARALVQRFEESSGYHVLLAFGSTGKHYAQIRNGAPFDVFLAADAERPARLEQEGLAVAGSRFSYARGRVVLWSPREGFVDGEGAVLAKGAFRHLALPNPKLAPYGRAAEEVLSARGLLPSLRDRIVRGENIGQTYQFVMSGNAELGFVAYSQVRAPGRSAGGSLWEVPRELYTAIDQQALLLVDSEAGRAFLGFLRSDAARRIIEAFGYGSGDAPC